MTQGRFRTRNKVKATLCCLLALCLPAPWVSAETTTEAHTSAAPELALEELRLFAEIFGQIKQSYVEEVSDKTLFENAIRGMLSGLDPHSAYFSEDEYERLTNAINGKYKGIGVELAVEAPYLKVVVPIEGGPAAKAGMKAGDLLTHIDGVSVLGLTLTEALDRLQGELGSQVSLTLLRDNETRVDVTVTRSLVTEKSVRYGMLKPGYGYLRIRHFAENTGQQFQQGVNKLLKQTELSGLVLDLRANPGGALDAAVAVADTLLSDGLIVTVKGRAPEAQESYYASSTVLAEGVNLVVLVDESSASASEIVAGALQDHQRAIVMGQQSYGKGSVQAVVPINGKAGFKMTTARYYTPNNRSIQALGITPDVEVEPAQIQKLTQRMNTVNERQLDGHLRNENESAEQAKRDALANDEFLDYDSDFQLFEALNLLQALKVVSAK
ncbi:MAG: S41 family peptidase [Pontibacterium sp.]